MLICEDISDIQAISFGFVLVRPRYWRYDNFLGLIELSKVSNREEVSS